MSRLLDNESAQRQAGETDRVVEAKLEADEYREKLSDLRDKLMELAGQSKDPELENELFELAYGIEL